MIQDIKSTCCGAADSTASFRTFFNHSLDPFDVFRFIQLRPCIFLHETLEDSQVVSEEGFLNGVRHMINGVVEACKIGTLGVEEKILPFKTSQVKIDFLTFCAKQKLAA